MDLHRNIRNFQGNSQAELRCWLFRAMCNRSRDLRRRYGPGTKRDIHREQSVEQLARTRQTIVAATPCPMSQMIHAEQSIAADHSLDRLAADHRQMLEFWAEGQLTYAQIGLRMGRSGDAIRKQCERTKRRLRHAVTC